MVGGVRRHLYGLDAGSSEFALGLALLHLFKSRWQFLEVNDIPQYSLPIEVPQGFGSHWVVHPAKVIELVTGHWYYSEVFNAGDEPPHHFGRVHRPLSSGDSYQYL